MPSVFPQDTDKVITPLVSSCQGYFLSSASSMSFSSSSLLRIESRALHMLGKSVSHSRAIPLDCGLLKQGLALYSKILPQLSCAKITDLISCPTPRFHIQFLSYFSKSSVEEKSNDLITSQKTDSTDVSKPLAKTLKTLRAESKTKAFLYMAHF